MCEWLICKISPRTYVQYVHTYMLFILLGTSYGSNQSFHLSNIFLIKLLCYTVASYVFITYL